MSDEPPIEHRLADARALLERLRGRMDDATPLDYRLLLRQVDAVIAGIECAVFTGDAATLDAGYADLRRLSRLVLETFE